MSKYSLIAYNSKGEVVPEISQDIENYEDAEELY